MALLRCEIDNGTLDVEFDAEVNYSQGNKLDYDILPGKKFLAIDLEERTPVFDLRGAWFFSTSDYETAAKILGGTADITFWAKDGTGTKIKWDGTNSNYTVKARNKGNVAVESYDGAYFRIGRIQLIQVG